MLIIRDLSNMFQQMSGMPVNSKSGKDMLRKAGIDTNSKQYQTVIQNMSAACKGVGYTNVQAIKNLMQSYDKDGDRINPAFGVSGLTVTDKNRAGKNRIISIPESIKDEMFELTKKEFLRENGVQNGERTKRSDVYRKLYKMTGKNDRLAAGHTLQEYEHQYLQAFTDAIKAVNPKWEAGMQIPAGALDHITRESVEAQSGGSFAGKGIDMLI